MKKVNLTREDGGRLPQWFDAEKAEHYIESTTWNGSNHISDATGTQTEHEALYKTKSGVYVLNHYSQWQGATETYCEISKQDAAEWLSKNGYDPDAVPEFQKEIEELEIT